MVCSRIRVLLSRTLSVKCRSGRVLDIPSHHTVFSPVGQYHDGDVVDPATVDVAITIATALHRGHVLIVDNRVEVVEAVA